MDLVFEKHPQIVLADLVMPNLTGMEVLERIMEFDPSTEVILMTAHYSAESAVEAIKKGANGYLNKPTSLAALRERVGKLVEEARRQQRSRQLEGELLANSEFEGMVGRSPMMREMVLQIRRVAPHYSHPVILDTNFPCSGSHYHFDNCLSSATVSN
jgi:DNA-binding NtrC family response regulator